MSRFEIGRFTFELAFRELSDDRGLAIQVFGPTASGAEEVLRFDCFEKTPHYHLGWSYRQAPFVPIAAADPFGWAVAQIGEHINTLLKQADAHEMNESELTLLAKVLTEIETSGRALRDAA